VCGIAGYINLDGAPVSPVILQQMTDAIAHRGPDGEGQWTEDNIALGHRRLAIIDLSPAGHQPMVSADHRYVLSYNGEIYNFRELRMELEAEGYWFRSRTDSEVVLNALAAWGLNAIDRFNGMFAFSFWDRKERKLLLARDRYGIKPLYYYKRGNTFAFASEQKSILAMPSIERKINKSALMEYFTFQNMFTNRVLLEDFKILQPGHYAVLDLNQKEPKLKQTQYWDFHFQEPTIQASEDEYREELERLFLQAVNRQLVSDVELGCYLSGGMDSGSITAIATQSYPYLKSFTCGFDLSSASGMEAGFDERQAAEAMSAYFKTEHYEMVLKAGDMERILPKMAWHLEEPRVGQSYPNFYVAQLASKFVKVVMSGTGGDEMFGGYPWRYYRAAVCNDFEHYIDQYYEFWNRLVPNKMLKKMFAPSWNDLDHVWTRDIFRDVFLTHKNQLETPEDYINHSLYFEAKTFMHGLLVVEDKLSMANGLETRVPFLDNDLVGFSTQCPVNLKLNNLQEVVRLNENDPGNKKNRYFSKTKDGKQILRDMMRRHVPDKIVDAVKQGFSAPDASWFKGESIDFVQRRLLNNNARINEYMDASVIKDMVDEHIDGRQNRRLFIWSLLNFEEFLEQYTD